MLRERVLGIYPNERKEVVGTQAEVLAASAPDGVYGVCEDTGAEVQWIGGNIVSKVPLSFASADLIPSGVNLGPTISVAGSPWGNDGQNNYAPAILNRLALATPQRMYSNHQIGVAGGWGLNSTAANGTLSVDTVNVRRPGVPVLRISAQHTTGTDDYVQALRKVDLSAVSGPLEFWVYVPDDGSGFNTQNAKIQVRAIYSADSPASDPPNAANANRRSVGPFSMRFGQWMCIRVDLSNVVAHNTSWTENGTSASNLRRVGTIGIYVVFLSASTQRYVLVDDVSFGGRNKTSVMLTVDNYHSDCVNTYMPLLNARNLRGSFFSDGNLIGPYKTELRALANAGWTIGHEGMNHKNYVTYAAELDADISSAEAAFDASGIPYSKVFGYPLFRNHAGTDAILKQRGYRLGRGYGDVMFAPGDGAELVSIGSADTARQLDGSTVATSSYLLSLVDCAIASGCSLMFDTHRVIVTVENADDTATATMAAFLDGLLVRKANGLIDIQTIDEFLEGRRGAL